MQDQVSAAGRPGTGGTDGPAVAADTAVRLQQALDEVHRLRQMLAALLEHVPQGVYWKDTLSCYQGCNQAFATAAGLASPAALVGKTDFDLWPELAEVYRADDREVISSGTAKLNYEEPLPRPGRHAGWIRTSKAPIRDSSGTVIGLVGAFDDLSEKRQMEVALVQMATDIDLFFDVTLELLCIADTQGRFRRLNPAWEQVLGYTREELLARPFLELVHPDDREATLGAMATLAGQGTVTNFVNRYRCKDGTYRWLEWRSVPAGERIYAAARDITDRRAVEVELRRAMELAEAATDAKSDFLARMSHEIRTPLNAVVGLSHLALQTPLTPKQRDYLSKLQTSAHALTALINNILDFSKIEAGKLELERTPFRLDRLLSTVTSMVALRAEDKGLALVVTTAPDLPRMLLGDSLRLGQVLANLVGNAVKFTERGSVDLTVALVDRDVEAARIRFEVRDTGIGMTAAQQSRLFEPFMQADRSVSRKYGGSGLGLAIARQLVALMGADLQIESAPDQGSRFWFTVALGVPPQDADLDGDADPDGSAAVLSRVTTTEAAAGPVDRGDDGCEHRETSQPRPARRRPGLSGARVLLVEDNIINQRVAREILESFGIVVEVAAHGREAVDLLENGRDYDAILMDLQMPVMDGCEATRAIRKAWPGRPLPIIAVTANVLQTERTACLDAGMDDYVFKPVDPERLESALRRWIAPRPDPAVVPSAPAEAGASPPLLPKALPGVDVESALARLGGNAELLLRLLRSFVEEHADTVDRISTAAAAADLDTALALAHGLKGVAGTLSLTAVSEAAQALEVGLRLQHRDQIPRHIGRLASALAVACQSIANLRAEIEQVRPVATLTAPSDGGAGRDEANLGRMLHEFDVLLRSRRFTARKQFERIRARIGDPDLRAPLDEVQACLDRLDYQHARELLPALARTLGVPL